MKFTRRELIKSGSLSLAGWAASLYAHDYAPLDRLQVNQIRVFAGADKPFSLLHVSDSHIAKIDSRDSAGILAFAVSRSRLGRELGEYYLDEAVNHARRAKIKLVHTGDFMEFMSEANFEYASRRLLTDDFIACVGNHEYWVDAEHPATEEYKSRTAERLKETWLGIPAAARRINGVNFFIFDNSFESITPPVVDAFESVVKEGLPIVMVCHVPLWAEACPHKANVCGMPGAKTTDETTGGFVERVRGEPLVRAILAGHVHEQFDFQFSASAREIVASALFKGQCNEIEFT